MDTGEKLLTGKLQPIHQTKL